MILKILKEKDTWLLGTGMFIGLCVGLIMGNEINLKPNIPMRIILGINLYLCLVFLVACIKWLDRLLVESRNRE